MNDAIITITLSDKAKARFLAELERAKSHISQTWVEDEKGHKAEVLGRINSILDQDGKQANFNTGELGQHEPDFSAQLFSDILCYYFNVGGTMTKGAARSAFFVKKFNLFKKIFLKIH